MSERYVIREGHERGKGRYWDGMYGRWDPSQRMAMKWGEPPTVAASTIADCRIVRLVPKRSEPDERDRVLDEARDLLHKLKPDIHIHSVERWFKAHDKLRGGK